MRINILAFKHLPDTSIFLLWFYTVFAICHISCSRSQHPWATPVWRCKVTGWPKGTWSQLWIPAMSSLLRSSSTSATLPEWCLQGRKTVMHPKSMTSSINVRPFCHRYLGVLGRHTSGQSRFLGSHIIYGGITFSKIMFPFPTFPCCWCRSSLSVLTDVNNQLSKFSLLSQRNIDLTVQNSPSADPGRDVCGEDQSHPVAGLSYWEPLCQDQQPWAHRHPGVYRLLLIRWQGEAGFQRGYAHTSIWAFKIS